MLQWLCTHFVCGRLVQFQNVQSKHCSYLSEPDSTFLYLSTICPASLGPIKLVFSLFYMGVSQIHEELSSFHTHVVLKKNIFILSGKCWSQLIALGYLKNSMFTVWNKDLFSIQLVFAHFKMLLYFYIFDGPKIDIRRESILKNNLGYSFTPFI